MDNEWTSLASKNLDSITSHHTAEAGVNISVSKTIFSLLFYVAIGATPFTAVAGDDREFAFPKIALGVSYAKVNPTSFSLQTYSGGSGNANFHYQYFMRDQWMLGLSAGFKSFSRLDSEESAFFCGSYEAQKLFRLYHPTWFGAGFKTMNLIGVERQNIPYTRDEKNPPQVGAGLVASLFQIVNRNVVLHSSVTRWRGTANNKLHAIEFSFGGSFKLVE